MLSPSAFSIDSTSSGASGTTSGENGEHVAVAATRNFSKFQRMSPVVAFGVGGLRELLVQRVPAVAVDLDLLGERERHVVVRAAERLDLVGRARLLLAELVARDADDVEALGA